MGVSMGKMLLLAGLAIAATLVWHYRQKPERWAVLYSREGDMQQLQTYDLLVFDRDGHPDLAPLQNNKRVLLGYVSFGEAEVNRKDYEQVKALGVLISGVEGWKGGDFIDVRNPVWHAYMLDTIIPELLQKGFSGVMLDTTDNLIWLEHKDPVAFAGMQQAAIGLIQKIRKRYPDMPIMMNRGLDILPSVSADIDMLLAESTYTSWSLAEGKPGMASDADQAFYRTKLKRPPFRFHWPRIYSLDYWPPEETDAVKKIYIKQRQEGYAPFVSTPDLQKLYPEP
ncbi:MAG: endo alpha-1,4 polygalactosaminidase [Rickettsiales bacterium]|nr:endo alpha-1,4 polygalactosaminidase [Rickettsiales bacterium]